MIRLLPAIAVACQATVARHEPDCLEDGELSPAAPHRREERVATVPMASSASRRPPGRAPDLFRDLTGPVDVSDSGVRPLYS